MVNGLEVGQTKFSKLLESNNEFAIENYNVVVDYSLKESALLLH